MALPDIIPTILVRALDPVRRGAPLLLFTRCFTGDDGLCAVGTRSARTNDPRYATSTRNRFRRCRYSVMFRLPHSLGLQVAPTAVALIPLGGQAVYTTHSPVGCLPRDVASLHARLGQLTWLDFHQLDRSLVGCSPHISFGRSVVIANSSASCTSASLSDVCNAQPMILRLHASRTIAR